MVSETTKPIHPHSPTEGAEKHKNKELDREIRNMVNAITGHITDHHKPGSSLQHEEDDDDDDSGVRIITLAGSNTGATFRSELNPDGVRLSLGEPEPLSTHVNSNFQAVNNSIMLSSSYSTSDPGVHLDITDVYEPRGHKPYKHGKKGKKKDKETFKSDHYTEKSEDKETFKSDHHTEKSD